MPNPLGVSSLSAQGPALWRSTEPTNPTTKGPALSKDFDVYRPQIATAAEILAAWGLQPDGTPREPTNKGQTMTVDREDLTYMEPLMVVLARIDAVIKYHSSSECEKPMCMVCDHAPWPCSTVRLLIGQ